MSCCQKAIHFSSGLSVYLYFLSVCIASGSFKVCFLRVHWHRACLMFAASFICYRSRGCSTKPARFRGITCWTLGHVSNEWHVAASTSQGSVFRSNTSPNSGLANFLRYWTTLARTDHPIRLVKRAITITWSNSVTFHYAPTPVFAVILASSCRVCVLGLGKTLEGRKSPDFVPARTHFGHAPHYCHGDIWQELELTWWSSTPRRCWLVVGKTRTLDSPWTYTTC